MTCKAIRFLLVSVLLTFCALFLAGCGGGGGVGSPSSLLPPPQPFEPVEHGAMLVTAAGVTSRYAAAVGTSGTDTAAEEALAWASSQANVAEVGRSDDGSVIWTRFSNGVISRLEHLTERMSPPSAAGPGRDVSLTPTGSFAAIFNGDFDAYYRQSANAASSTLSQHAYTVLPSFNGASFTPKALADFGDADVMFIASHGNGAPCGAPLIATGLHRDDANDAIYKQCLTEGSVVWSTYEFEGVTYGPYYAVTDRFVRSYVKPCPRGRSLVFVSACRSLEPSQALADAFRSRGADVTYLGWVDHPRNDKAPLVEGALWDLLTARRSVIASADIPPSMVPSGNTADNPLNLTDSLVILHAMASYEAAAGTMLDFVGNSQWGLMPHLDKAEVVSDKLVLTGSFGEANGSVWAVPAGQETAQRLQLISWGAARIVAGLPSADAQVYVKSPGGLDSNRLNVWLGSTLILEVTEDEVTDNGHHFQVLGWAVPAGSERGLVRFQQASDFLIPVAYNTGGVPFMDYLCSYNVGYYDDPNDPNDMWAANWYLRYPILAGDTWTSRGLSNGMVVSSTVQVVSTSEAVTVPAGTFLCAKVVETMSVPPGYGADSDYVVTRYERWLGSGTGWVKFRVSRSDGKTVLGELVKFSGGGGGEPYFFPMALGSQWTFRWRIQ
jgi:hypothetical protein